MLNITQRQLIRSLLLLLICLCSAVNATGTTESDKKECARTKQKIERIRSKMRQGYNVSQGIKMEDELRRLRKVRSKVCRYGS